MNKEELMQKKKAFVSFVKKYGETNKSRELMDEIDNTLFQQELIDMGYPTLYISSSNYIDMPKCYSKAECVILRNWDTKRQSISWEDNDKQPCQGETLFKLSFSCGAYVFTGDCKEYYILRDLFKETVSEFLKFKPRYSDSHNNSYYFTLEDGAKVYANYKQILDNAFAKVPVILKEYRKQKLMEQLKELEEE